MKNELGLLGYPLSHSFSQKFFIEKFRKLGLTEIYYENFSFERLDDFIGNSLSSNLKGFNVTIPHKNGIYKICNELSLEASEIKAVNCVSIVTLLNQKKTFIGHNTDAPAFDFTLNEYNFKPGSKALIIGNGGSSLAVNYVLKNKGFQVDIVCRNPIDDKQFLFSQINELDKYKIVVNCTPLGMYPNIKICPPINYDSIVKDQLFYDLIYNPEKTEFLKKAEIRGARIRNGFDMLISQAELSWEIWNKDHLFIESPGDSNFKTDIS